MREILFTAKRKDNGEWVEGNLFVPDLETADTQICIGTPIIRITYNVIPETARQYIGHRDANNKKMFDGDIVKHDGEIYRIGFWHTSFWLWRGGLSCIDHIPIGENDYYALEVIGNIHDNPELLEQAEKEYWERVKGE